MKDSPEPTLYSTRRIAVVEGDQAAAEMLHTFFRLLDLEPSLIDPAGDVFATIGRLHPDVALLDADLPNLRAVDLAAHLRRDDPHLGLLFTSGSRTEPIDGIAVVGKPRRFEDLLDVMDAVLQAAARSRPAV
jgi:DNA-binding response OmpR family regulator